MEPVLAQGGARKKVKVKKLHSNAHKLGTEEESISPPRLGEVNSPPSNSTFCYATGWTTVYDSGLSTGWLLATVLATVGLSSSPLRRRPSRFIS